MISTCSHECKCSCTQPAKFGNAFKKLYRDDLQQKIDSGSISCPYCHTINWICFGVYTKQILHSSLQAGPFLLAIQRFRCRDCFRTFSVRPPNVFGYFPFTEEFLSAVIHSSPEDLRDVLVMVSMYRLKQLRKLFWDWVNPQQIYDNPIRSFLVTFEQHKYELHGRIPVSQSP